MLTDQNKMPFGKWTGTRLANVPADYLIWIYENKKCNAEVAEYIKDNLEVLKKEVGEKQNKYDSNH
jgi:uncharacterized protein (DUF3820 family)